MNVRRLECQLNHVERLNDHHKLQDGRSVFRQQLHGRLLALDEREKTRVLTENHVERFNDHHELQDGRSVRRNSGNNYTAVY